MRNPTIVVENAYILCMDASTCTTRVATLEYYGYSRVLRARSSMHLHTRGVSK